MNCTYTISAEYMSFFFNLSLLLLSLILLLLVQCFSYNKFSLFSVLSFPFFLTFLLFSFFSSSFYTDNFLGYHESKSSSLQCCKKCLVMAGQPMEASRQSSGNSLRRLEIFYFYIDIYHKNIKRKKVVKNPKIRKTITHMEQKRKEMIHQVKIQVLVYYLNSTHSLLLLRNHIPPTLDFHPNRQR